MSTDNLADTAMQAPHAPPGSVHVVTLEEAYGSDGVALLAANPMWDLADLDREMAARGIPFPAR